MVWTRRENMYWVCYDVPGVIMDIFRTRDKQWVFIAAEASDGRKLEQSTHSGFTSALKMSKKYEELLNGFEDKSTQEKIEVSTTEIAH